MRYKYIYIFLITFGNLPWIYGQTTGILSEKEVKEIITNEFTNLISGEPASIGTYASVDTQNTSLTFSVNFDVGDYNMLGLTIAGNSLDREILPLFSNSSLNTGISVGLLYHKIITKKSRILSGSYGVMHYNSVLAPLQAADEELTIENQERQFEYIKSLFEEREEINGSLSEIEKLLKNVNNNISTLENKKSLISLNSSGKRLSKAEKNKIKKIEEELKSLNNLKKLRQAEILKLESKKDAVNKSLEIDNLELTSFLLGKIKAEITQDYDKDYQFDKYDGVDISWISCGLKFKKKSFKLLDDEALLLSNIKDTTFTGFEAKIEYSEYRDISTSSFLNVGLVFRSIDNLSSLRKVNLEETTIFEEDESSQVSGTSDFNFFQGAYKNKISELSLFLNYYRFINKKRSVAFHVLPQIRFTEFQNPLLDLEVGLLVPVKNKKKKGSIINAELFYSLSDLTSKHSPSRARLLDSGVIGLRLTLPFNINF